MEKAFIFDMDGVIINTEEIFDRYFEELGNDIGIDLSKKIIDPLRGLSDDKIWKYLIEQYNLKESPDYYNTIVLDKVNNELRTNTAIELEDGILELLDYLKLKKYRIALASSADKERILLIIDQFKIKAYFEVVVSADDVENAKPNPDIYLLAAKQLKVHPKNCWVLEDSTFGIKAAKSAGMKCIGYKGAYETFQNHQLADRQVTDINSIKISDLQ